MFGFLKLIVTLFSLLLIANFVLQYFGYEFNRDYFNQSKKECLEQLNECKKEYIQQGTENAECNFDCVDPKLFIKRDDSHSKAPETEYKIIDPSEPEKSPIDDSVTPEEPSNQNDQFDLDL